MAFANAPVTLAFVIQTVLFSLVVGVFDVKQYFHLQLVPHLSVHHQFWRLLTHHVAFANSSDVLLAALVFLNVSVPVERQFGSRKFASFALVTCILATLIEFLSLLAFHSFGINHIPAGCFALLFAILYQHVRIIPQVYAFRIFGVPLSNDSFRYFIALQLAISHLPGSLLSCAVGFACGLMYRSDLVNLKAYRISPRICSLAHRFLLPLLDPMTATVSSPRSSTRALPEGTPIETFNLGDDEVITTSHRGASSDPRRSAVGSTGTSRVVREWVGGITSLDPRNHPLPRGLRTPADTEIVQVTAMFPELEREVIVAALQRSSSAAEAVNTLLGNSQQSHNT